MMKSMTGFSKAEANDQGINAVVEIKSLNGKNLEINCRMPRSLSHKELEIREILRQNLTRGSITVNVNIEFDSVAKPFVINEDAAVQCYETLNNLKKKMKLKDAVKLEHVLTFRDSFGSYEKPEDEETQMKLVFKALKTAIKNLDTMRLNEGRQITKDIVARMKNIQDRIKKVEAMSAERIPSERERLRQRVAQLFDSDEIDERRLQMEIAILADKLDVSEECVRLDSHFIFFNEAVKSKEPAGRKINFLLQEINREINTIGSKGNDASISQLVVESKEELERIREQVQNIE